MARIQVRYHRSPLNQNEGGSVLAACDYAAPARTPAYPSPRLPSALELAT